MNIKGIIYLGIAILTFAFTHITDKLGINSGVAPITGLVLVLICAIFITRFKATYKTTDAPEVTSYNRD